MPLGSSQSPFLARGALFMWPAPSLHATSLTGGQAAVFVAVRYSVSARLGACVGACTEGVLYVAYIMCGMQKRCGERPRWAELARVRAFHSVSVGERYLKMCITLISSTRS